MKRKNLLPFLAMGFFLAEGHASELQIIIENKMPRHSISINEFKTSYSVVDEDKPEVEKLENGDSKSLKISIASQTLFGIERNSKGATYPKDCVDLIVDDNEHSEKLPVSISWGLKPDTGFTPVFEAVISQEILDFLGKKGYKITREPKKDGSFHFAIEKK